MYPWTRLDNPHAFVREGRYVRTATVTYDGTTHGWFRGSKPWSFSSRLTRSSGATSKRDTPPCNQPATGSWPRPSRPKWLHDGTDADWGKSYDTAMQAMLDAFAGHHSLALQHTLYDMGGAVINGQPGIAEIRFSAPNKHHFIYDLARFDIENNNEVFHD